MYLPDPVKAAFPFALTALPLGFMAQYQASPTPMQGLKPEIQKDPFCSLSSSPSTI